MSYFQVIDVIVSAKVQTPNGVGYTTAIEPIDGSPFRCRDYRASGRTVNFNQSAGGTSTVDTDRRLKFLDVTAPIGEKMQCTLPSGERLLIKRVRKYGWTLQADVESGTL